VLTVACNNYLSPLPRRNGMIEKIKSINMKRDTNNSEIEFALGGKSEGINVETSPSLFVNF
jgi:hypothetical protein